MTKLIRGLRRRLESLSTKFSIGLGRHLTCDKELVSQKPRSPFTLHRTVDLINNITNVVPRVSSRKNPHPQLNSPQRNVFFGRKNLFPVIHVVTSML